MSKKEMLRGFSPSMDYRSMLLFIGVGLIIIAITLWNWHYDGGLARARDRIAVPEHQR
jgi:hypothetical protein